MGRSSSREHRAKRGAKYRAKSRAIPRTVARVVLTGCVALLNLVSTPSVLADGILDREIDFHISQGSLEAALFQFSKQAHVPIALAAHVTGTLQTPGLHGRLLAAVALERLLHDSGLTFQTIGETVTVVQVSTAAEPAHHAPEAETPLAPK